MTVFNREKYIADAIESVMASTYQNWELIIVDDQSKDRSVEIAKTFEARDSRIKVYVNDINLGDYPNRNQAARYAKGQYLKYLDADDLIYPHGLEVMVSAMLSFPDADFGTQYNIREFKMPYPILINSREAFFEHFFGNSFFQSGPTGTIFKRDTFFLLGGFSGKRYIGDTEMWMKFSFHGPIVIFQPSLIWWRQHEGQEFQLGQSVDGYIKHNHELFFTTIKNELLPLSIEEKKIVTKQYRKNLSRRILAEAIKRRDFKKAHQIYKVCDHRPLNFLNLFA
jgi:glycosyltransferase involved in cell wall biosynthesis